MVLDWTRAFGKATRRAIWARSCLTTIAFSETTISNRVPRAARDARGVRFCEGYIVLEQGPEVVHLSSPTSALDSDVIPGANVRSALPLSQRSAEELVCETGALIEAPHAY